MTSRTRLARILSFAVVPVLLVTGCSSGAPTPEAGLTRAVAQIQKAIANGDLGSLTFTTPDGAAQFTAARKPIAGYPTNVEKDKLDFAGSKATVSLNLTTTFGAAGWKHPTKVDFLKSGGTWKVIWRPSIFESSLAADEKLVVTRVKALRGNILGGNDQPLVQPRGVVRFGIDKALAAAKFQTADLTVSARRLATLLGITSGPFIKAVTKAGPKAFVEAVVLRDKDATSALLGQVESIPGARTIADKLPLAPTRDFAAALLGTVGQATAELIKKSNGALHVGDETGLSGLQLRYNDQLSGTSGVKVYSEIVGGANAGNQRLLFFKDAVAGEPLKLTLNQRLQTKAQQLLTRYGPASALVAIRPSTGEILAAASGPGSGGYNTATFGQYAPGSTFKVVSSLALLRSGLTPTSKLTCPATTVVNGKRFKNYSDYPSNHFGSIALREAVAYSCNTAFVTARGRIKGTALADAAAALGFGVDHDMGYPAYFGQVPTPQSETEAAADLIGQGKVLASPMSMAAVVASVARGATVVPDLIRGDAPVVADPAVPLTKSEAGSLRQLMRAVVEEGSGSFLASLGSPAVIAKTGTAEYGTKAPLLTHAWMIGAQGDLAVAVFVDTGQSGSKTAGPVLEDFLRAAAG